MNNASGNLQQNKVKELKDGYDGMKIVIMTMIVVIIVDLEKDKVKELEDRYDGDAKGEPVDATKVRQEHFPCVTEI